MGATNLIQIFVRHRNAANLLMIMMIIVGIAAISRLNTQFFPDFGVETVTATVIWPGASADDVDRNITTAILPEVRFLNSIKRVRSFSSEGRSVIVAEFVAGTDI